MLEKILLKLQHEENYDDNRLLGRILVDYIQLYQFKENFGKTKAKFDLLLDKVTKVSQ